MILMDDNVFSTVLIKVGNVIGLLGVLFSITDIQVVLSSIFVLFGIASLGLDIVIKWKKIGKNDPEK
jgi:hypothetical protein